MFQVRKLAWTLAAASLLFLAACGSPAATTDPNVRYTESAITVQAELTRIANLTPSSTPTPPATATFTPEPPTSTPAATNTPLPPVGTATNTPLPPPPTTEFAPDRAEYVSENIPDKTKFVAGTSFTKTWTLRNTGTTTWTTAYALRFFGGDQMGGADVNLPHEVKPGETIDISVTFTAPASTGIKHGNWTLQNDKGQNFKPIVWVEIEVVSSLASTSTTIAATPTLTPTETPTPAASTDVP
ncbi:MAG TPA: NBR1-Ig-like domain-containing protein [Anaerolineaceae bacterium]|nr:NBR1-Ig-like domain-containing protein [Anaerolineaceae bacterium]